MVVRQARIYLAGGISGTALIAVAVVAFVVLVSLQTLRDWPLNGIGDDRSGAVQDSAAVATGVGARGPTTAGASVTSSTAGGEAPRSRGQAGDGAVTVGGAGEAAGSPAAVRPAARAPSSNPATGLGGSSRSGDSAPSGGSTPRDGEGSSPSLSQAAAGTVNETIAGVDSATGGALGNAGVTETTEEVVNGAAGPKSAVGRTVDRTTQAVGGLPGGDR